MQKKSINGREIEYADVVHHHTETRLSFFDRLKVLFGKPILVHSEIYTKETCSFLGSEAKTFVPPLIQKRPRGKGMCLETPSTKPL